MSMKICSKRLTTCHVATDGTNVGLEFLDQSGGTVTVELPLDQAEAVVMTLPHLLARALKRQTGNDDARYVFGLQGWSIEGAKEQNCLITILVTTNGFEVSFGIPFEACNSLGWNLMHGAEVTPSKQPTATGTRSFPPAVNSIKRAVSHGGRTRKPSACQRHDIFTCI